MKCNHLEALKAVYPDWNGEADEAKLKECALVQTQRMRKPVFITWGSSGIVAAHGDKAVRIPAIKVEGPIDICGAGDSATAGIVSSLTSGASIEEAALIGNIAASVTIRQIGTTGTASAEKILKSFRKYCC
jgi:sugar/nucleoside kinase (ribokinase family)